MVLSFPIFSAKNSFHRFALSGCGDLSPAVVTEKHLCHGLPCQGVPALRFQLSRLRILLCLGLFKRHCFRLPLSRRNIYVTAYLVRVSPLYVFSCHTCAYYFARGFSNGIAFACRRHGETFMSRLVLSNRTPLTSYVFTTEIFISVGIQLRGRLIFYLCKVFQMSCVITRIQDSTFFVGYKVTVTRLFGIDRV